MDGKQVSNSTQLNQFAQALMLEQIRFTQQYLLNAESNAVLDTFVSQAYAQFNRIKLKDIVNLEQLHAVVSKYAFELNLGPDLLEFIGTVAQRIYLHLKDSNALIGDLISDHDFGLWLNKILELDQVRYGLKQQILSNEKAHAVSLQLANQILEKYTPWLDRLRKNKVQNHMVKSKIFNFLQDQQHTLELKLESQLANAILVQLGEIITLPQNELYEIIQHIWSDLQFQKISAQLEQIEAIDVEDFFILVYETWRNLRQSSEIQSIILEVVDEFYEYFGNYSLQALLTAVGLTQEDLVIEAHRFAPQLITMLNDFGILEQLIQSLIQPFYQAQSTLDLISGHLER